MRNVWKGLVVGGLTGALAGVLLDAGDRASRVANQDVRRASGAARRAMERSELPGRVRSVTRRAFSADTAEQARDLAGRAASSARDAAGTLAEEARQRSGDVADRWHAAAPH
jgi:hypothetical protein